MTERAPAMLKGTSIDPSNLKLGENPPVANEAEIKNALGKMPMTFIENKGQMDARVRYYAKTGSGTIWLSRGITDLALHSSRTGACSNVRKVCGKTDR
ncbi:MAG: hypothetical protein WC291_07410 [Thermodesulfovibrionales bacterium]